MACRQILGLGLAMLSALGAAACSGAPGEAAPNDTASSASTGESAVAAPRTEGELLATVSFPDGQSVEFTKLAAGDLFVVSAGPMGQAPHLKMTGQSVVEMYKSIANGAEVPAALLNAEAERASMARAAPISAAVSRPPAPSAAPSARFKTEGTAYDDWFTAKFCTDDPNSTGCVSGNNQSISTSWTAKNSYGQDSYVMNAVATAENNGTKASTELLQIFRNNAWATYFSHSIQPGYWNQFGASTVSNSYWAGNESTDGGDAIIEMQVYAPTITSVAYESGPGLMTFTGMGFQGDNDVLVNFAQGSLSSQVSSEVATFSDGNGEWGLFTNASPGLLMFGACASYPATGIETTMTAKGMTTGQIATSKFTMYDCAF